METVFVVEAVGGRKGEARDQVPIEKPLTDGDQNTGAA